MAENGFMDAYLASGLGALVGALIVLLFLWRTKKKRPHWYTPKKIKDTAQTLVVVGMAFALLSYPIGKTYFLLWLFYGIAISLTVFGIVVAYRTRQKAVKK